MKLTSDQAIQRITLDCCQRSKRRTGLIRWLASLVPCLLSARSSMGIHLAWWEDAREMETRGRLPSSRLEQDVEPSSEGWNDKGRGRSSWQSTLGRSLISLLFENEHSFSLSEDS